MTTATTTPISFEWFTPTEACIYRAGKIWAKLRFGACTRRDVAGNDVPVWCAQPVVETRDGHLEEGAWRSLVAFDPLDQEVASLMAIAEVGAPNFRPPPRFATDAALWAHVKAKNPTPYDEWGPKDFAAAQVIYRHSARKYGDGNPELAAKYGVVLD